MRYDGLSIFKFWNIAEEFVQFACNCDIKIFFTYCIINYCKQKVEKGYLIRTKKINITEKYGWINLSISMDYVGIKTNNVVFGWNHE